MNGLDQQVFRSINGWPDDSAPFWLFLSEATHRSGGLILLVAVTIGLLVWTKTRKATLLALASWPLADAMTKALKYVLQWNRPSWPDVLAAHPDFHVRGVPSTGYGTASAHSANMMAVAVAFLWLYKPAGWFWFVVAILTGVSRIYVGDHWPSEVVFGWFCGFLCATVVVKTWEAYVTVRSRKNSLPPESPAEAP